MGFFFFFCVCDWTLDGGRLGGSFYNQSAALLPSLGFVWLLDATLQGPDGLGSYSPPVGFGD